MEGERRRERGDSQKALAMAMLSRKLMRGATTMPIPSSCNAHTHTHTHTHTQSYTAICIPNTHFKSTQAHTSLCHKAIVPPSNLADGSGGVGGHQWRDGRVVVLYERHLV